MSRTTSRGQVSIELLCETFHVSRQAYYAARKQPTPAPRRRPAPPGDFTPTSDAIEAIRRVCAAHTAWGVRKVWATLRREKLVVSRNRVWLLMATLGLLQQAVELRNEERRGTVAVTTSNRRWATDLTTVWTRKDGLVAVVPVIDCGDRCLLACDVTKSQASAAVLAPVVGALKAAFGTAAGVPDGLELRSDHGPQYTGGDCEALCQQWRLSHTFAPVGRPTGNAVAERVILTIKLELIWARDWESADELRQALTGWMQTYNAARPHQALAWATPHERRAQNLSDRTVAA
jgi:transposase InsO family protein